MLDRPPTFMDSPARRGNDGTAVRSAAATTAAAVFVVYLLTLAWSPVPGAPAALIVKHTGLSEIPPLVHPVWNGLCHLLGSLPGVPLAAAIHTVCAMMAAASVGLLVLVTARLAGLRPRLSAATPADGGEGEVARPAAADADADPEPWIRAASGVMAGLILAFCVPFWLAATRASTHALEVLLLLSAASRLLAYLDRGRPAALAGAALLAGLGAAESPAVVLATPLLLLGAAIGIVRHGLAAPGRGARASVVPAVALAAWTAGFLVPTLAQAVRFACSPAPAWMGLAGGGAVALAALRAFYGGIRDAVPRIGWILIAAETVVPAVLYVWARLRPPHLGVARLTWTCLLLSLLGASLVLNLPLAPWPVFGGQSPPSMPYVWIAAWTGLSVSVLLRLLLRGARRRGARAAFPGPLRVVASLAVAVTLAAAGLNVRHADGRAARPFGWLARGIVAEAEGADWILSRGLWDDIVQIAAYRREPPLRTVRWTLARQPAYAAWFAARQSADARVAGLAAAGLEAAVPVWLASTATPARAVAAIDLPAAFASAGCDPVAGLWLYHRGSNAVPASARSLRELDRWRRAAAGLRDRVERSVPPLRDYGRLALRHAARVMNDRGVHLEDAGRPEDAIRAYTAALDANPSNLVARVNLSRVVRGLGRMEAARIDASLVRYLEEMPGPVDIVGQTELDGTLRDPAAMAARGLRRAATSDLPAAVADLLSALALGASNDVVAASAARALATQGRADEAMAVLDDAARRSPGSDTLRIARSHLALAAGDPDAAVRILDGAAADDPRRRLTEAMVCMARNDWPAADAALREFLQHSPTNAEALALSAVAGLRLGQPARVRAAEEALRDAGRRHPLVSLSRAVLLVEEGQAGPACQVLEGILVHHPAYRPARELLIGLEEKAGRTAAVRDHVFALLRQSPDDPKANLMLATWQAEAGSFRLAEATLRAVLARSRSPAVLNNLAWAIREQGRAGEALPLAEEAVRLAPGFASAHDTLAVVLADLGRMAEAAKAAEAAVRCAPDNHAILERATRIRSGRGVPRGGGVAAPSAG